MFDNTNHDSCFNIAKGLKITHENFGANILKEVRKVNGMTQQQVADGANISLRHYQKFESGEREITNASFRIAMAVIKVLEINPEILTTNQSRGNTPVIF